MTLKELEVGKSAVIPVSYTHRDVYKRQAQSRSATARGAVMR